MTEHSRRLLSWGLTDYCYLGWHIYDGDVWFVCDHCGLSGFEHYANMSQEEIDYLSGFARPKLPVIQAQPLDALIRLARDVDQGAYSPEGDWVPWPVYQLEILDLEQEVAMEKKRRENQTLKLAQWFVTNVLKRPWADNDFHGPHMKHAAELLKRYPVRDICGALEANRDGLIGDGYELKFMKAIESSGEPPLIKQWLEYKANADGEVVPVYLTSEYQEWQTRKDRTYAEVEVDPGLPVPEGGEVRAGDGQARRSRRRQDLAAEPLPEFHQRQLFSGGEQGQEGGVVPEP